MNAMYVMNKASAIRAGVMTLASAAIVGAATLTLGVGTADAATCSGTGCDGKDPVNSGCSASAVTVDSKSTAKGRFDLLYSRTCGTNWVRTPNYAGGSSRPDHKLELTVWDVNRDKVVRFYANPTRGVHYGNMVYSPGSHCARGYADWNGGDWNVRLASSTC